MTIQDVKLIHYPEIKPGTLEDGLPVASRLETVAFSVTTEEERVIDEVIVPNDPQNSHYRMVADWYAAQAVKPFTFSFYDFSQDDALPAETTTAEAEPEQESPSTPELPPGVNVV